MMNNLDSQSRPYHMENVEEQGQVVETTMTFVSSGPTPASSIGPGTGGRNGVRKPCGRVREEAQREQQRREKYR